MLLLKRPALTLAIGISAAHAVGLLAWFIFDQSIGLDFGVYWRAASEPLSIVYQPRDVLNFPYPPTMLLWISPLSLIPLWLAFTAWTALSVGALVLASRRHLSAPQIALCLFSPPVFYALLNGQVTLALAALLLWACGAKNRALAGMAFAIIATVKPQLVIMAPLMLLVSKDWDALWVAVLYFAALLLASVVAFGTETWLAWFNSLGHFNAIVLKNNVLAVAATPFGVARYWGLPPWPFLILGAVLGAWLAVKCRDADPMAKCAAIATGSLLAAPYAVTYDLSPLVPFLVWAVFRGSILAAVAMSSALNPLPLALATYQLIRRPM